MFVRVEVAVRPEYIDPKAKELLRRIELAHPVTRRMIRWARLLEVYWLQTDAPRGEIISAVHEIFHDKVLQWLFTGGLIPSAAGKSGNIGDLMDSAPQRPGVFWGLERRYRPGVTDNTARTTTEAFHIILGNRIKEVQAASGALLLLEGPELNEEILSQVSRDVFYNDLIESCTVLSEEELKKLSRFQGDQIKRQLPKVSLKASDQVDTYTLDGLSPEELTTMSRKKLWALNHDEMTAVRDFFAERKNKAIRSEYGLREPTDVEMEVIAQTWSEHCKHKIFGAKIHYNEKSTDVVSTNQEIDFEVGSFTQQTHIPEVIDGLFKTTIAGTTRELDRPWLLSVFSDNAGIVAIDEETAFCMKVETHNSPSALDPYGGALTGIVGVNRDILGCGYGAKPIFNTDVFCLAPPDYNQKLPDRLLHPRRILEGVSRGVEHGGNKSGIPTVNGALVFDSRYLGKPLIYCGTGGVMPRKVAGTDCESKNIEVGDYVCMVGGLIGKDGIHGATFSSMALDESSPATAVQLGDPITQKRALDFLLEARNQGLYRTLTDNGAGGLSSSVGELATITNGARIDVGRAGKKYPGLKPYELVVSESQERMTVAVQPENLDEFLKIAKRRDVAVSVLGEFTNSGRFEIFYNGNAVGVLDLEFLHKGNPRLELKGEWAGSQISAGYIDLSFENDGPKHLMDLLSRPNITSKEWLIRQYDHEVQGMSVIKPLHTASVGTKSAVSGPNDGGVVKVRADSWLGVSVGCGINPKLSDIDPYLMAQSAVDEAVRNVLCVGGEYGKRESVIALVDNFCWPDPVGDSQKTAALVRACYGMREACLKLGIPLISGKDSMKNDFRGKKEGKEVVISVPPTLLMTAVARVPDVREARTADFKMAGDRIYLLGGQSFGLIGSELHSMYSERLRAKGGKDRQVVLPSSLRTKLHIPGPDWKKATQTYTWLGGAEGELQGLLRSAHDLSEGGLLVALTESLLARGLGACVEIPEGQDLWEFSFGEGFHSFVVSVRDQDGRQLEDEWKKFNVPFIRLGEVTATAQLEVKWYAGSGQMDSSSKKPWRSFTVGVQDLRKAWKREGYWE